MTTFRAFSNPLLSAAAALALSLMLFANTVGTPAHAVPANMEQVA